MKTLRNLVLGLSVFGLVSCSLMKYVKTDSLVSLNTPEGLFTFLDWQDMNGDSIIDRNELKDFNLPAYNIKDQDSLYIGFYPGPTNLYDGKITFRVRNIDKGLKTITEFEDIYEKGVKTYLYDLKNIPESGKYLFIMYTENGHFYHATQIIR